MKTRIISFVLIFMLSVSLAVGQSTDKAKTSFAILGGMNFQNLVGTDTYGNKLENDMISGYHVGFNIQIPFAPMLYFQPGLLFTTLFDKRKKRSYFLIGINTNSANTTFLILNCL